MAQCLHAYSAAFWCSTWLLRRPNTEFFPWTKVLKINPSFPFWVGFVMFFLTVRHGSCPSWLFFFTNVCYKWSLDDFVLKVCSSLLMGFFWGRDNCSFLQRKLSHGHTLPKPLASLSKSCVQSRGRILFETFGLEKLVWKWTQFFLWWNVHLVQDFLHRIIILFWRFHFGKLKILKDSLSMVTIFIELPFFPVSVVKFSFIHVTIRSFRMNTHLNE
jgi:hypothetical protein